MTPAVRAVNWKVVAFAAAAFWLLVGLAVARHAFAAPAGPAAKSAGTTSTAALKPAPRPAPAVAAGESPPGGEWAWFGLAAVAEPRLIGVQQPAAVGPFRAKLTDPPADPEPLPMLPAAVFRRALDKNPGRLTPPPFILGKPTLGTHVAWEANPQAAIDAAAERDKLVVVFQVAGPTGGFFTGNDATAIRGMLLGRKPVADAIQNEAAVALQKVEILRGTRPPRAGGAAVAFILTTDGTVIHAVPGAVPPEEFLREVAWAKHLHREDTSREGIRDAHRERLKRDYRFALPFDATPRLVPFRPAPGPLRHPGVRHLTDRAKVHAAVAMFPRAALADFAPLIWDEVLSQ